MGLTRFCQVLTAGALLAVAQAPPEVLTDQEVARAIARADRLPEQSVCVGRAAAGHYNVCFQGPEQRIGAAATLAKESRTRLRPADVSVDMKARTWTVVVRPNRPALVDGRPVRTPFAEDLTIKSIEQPEKSMRPRNLSRVAVTWDNAVGVELKGQGLTATIEPSELPGSDLDVIVTAAGGSEHRYVLSQASRDRIH
jgi:hypothetical protein